MGTGDKPIFLLNNHRLDKKMLNYVSSFLQEGINRSLGSIFGGSGGLLTILDYTLSNASPTQVSVSFAAFRCAWSAPLEGDPSTFDGGVMTFDPNRPAQVTSSWPLEAFQGKAVLFWAKRKAANAVIDNQSYWEGGAKYTPVQTVESEYVEIVPRLASAGAPDETFGWVKFAYIRDTGWSSLTPTIGPVYFPDSKFFPTGSGPGRDNWWSMYDPDVSGGGNPGVALGDQLRWIFNVLSRFNDSNWEFFDDGRIDEENNNGTLGWQARPTRGFLQINTAIDVQGNTLEDHEERITLLEGADPTTPLIREALILEFRYNVGTDQYDKVTIYSNGWLTSSHTTLKDDPGDVGGAVELTLTSTGSGAYTIYAVDGQGLRTPSSSPPWGTGEDFSMSYDDSALPSTAVIVRLQAGLHPNGSIRRILVRVTAGKTP